MPEQLDTNTLQQSHAQNLRHDALRRLSRSPHPYHRQQFELPYGYEKFSTNAIRKHLSLNSAQVTDDEVQERPKTAESYRSGSNDSGTEADDEHFLKGLPAPKLRPHKGLRGTEYKSGSPSPLPSPAILDELSIKVHGFFRRSATPARSPTEGEEQKARKLRQKRSVEVVRRTTEAGILIFLGSLLCLNPEVRQSVYFWGRHLSYQLFITAALVAVYPLRLLWHTKPQMPCRRPFPLALPANFDPAPLFYPSSIPLLVSLVFSKDNPAALLPTIILGISSLPRHLIPSTGGLEGSHISQWFLSCVPLLFESGFTLVKSDQSAHSIQANLQPEILVLLYPLHQALCVTLHTLTTTSLLSAELQLLSISLIDLLLLASSPQAIILKALLWGGGLGILVSCGHVLKWGVALARVPKWRFRRSGQTASIPTDRGWTLVRKAISFGVLGKSVLAQDSAISDSSDDGVVQLPSRIPSLKLNTRDPTPSLNGIADNGSVSAIEPKSTKFTNGSGKMDSESSFSMNRRHTLPSISNLPPKSNKSTPSGRRKRAASSSVQSFFSLTNRQATVRKWLYACYVYICILAIILIGIRQYVSVYALQGNEPIGWALGYLLGDIPYFRLQVLSYNLQTWICLPPHTLSHQSTCHLGLIQHLRLSSFGPANTRLILSAYWLAVLLTGLLIVLRLSSIYEVDTRRKVFHFMMVLMLLPSTFIDPAFCTLALSLILAIFLLLDLFRASQLPPLSKSLAYFLTPYVDGRDLKGPVVISHIFLLIGCAIPLWLSLASLPRTGDGYLEGWEVPTRDVSMVSGVICVGLGDAFASLIGRRFGRRKWIWGGGKSIEGSLAFAMAVGIALCIAKAWLRFGGWMGNNDNAWYLTATKAGLAAGIASLTEAVLTGGNDNVVVPVVLWIACKGLDI